MGRDGVILIDDDHRDQIMYSEHGYSNAYAPDQKLNLAFLGSRSSGEWADGIIFGLYRDETKEWLDFTINRAKCHLTTAKEAGKLWRNSCYGRSIRNRSTGAFG
ncbi:MAG: hypothetical protein CM15mP73_3230 [Hyphomicrobiales bacterium]|nr:MAG: hypothetical protein CM15mP73_3230 [Hyphomicrobiales bacterium]